MSFPPSFFDHLEDRLNLAVYDINQVYRMGEVPPIVYWHKPPLDETEQSTEQTKMSNITGIQSGAFQDKIAAMQKKLADRLGAGLTKIDVAAEAGAVKMEAAVDGIVAKVDKEIDDKLQEFATMTNGGPV